MVSANYLIVSLKQHKKGYKIFALINKITKNINHRLNLLFNIHQTVLDAFIVILFWLLTYQ